MGFVLKIMYLVSCVLYVVYCILYLVVYYGVALPTQIPSVDNSTLSVSWVFKDQGQNTTEYML